MCAYKVLVFNLCAYILKGDTQSWLRVKYITGRALLIKRIKLLPVSVFFLCVSTQVFFTETQLYDRAVHL